MCDALAFSGAVAVFIFITVRPYHVFDERVEKKSSKSVSVQVTGILWVFLCMPYLRLEHLMVRYHLMSLNHIIFFCQPTSWIFYRMFFVYRVHIMLERLLQLLLACSRSHRECVSHSVHLLYSFVSPFISSWFDHLRIQNPLNNRKPQQKQQQRTAKGDIKLYGRHTFTFTHSLADALQIFKPCVCVCECVATLHIE